jgi:hypothetical protein
MHQHLWTMMAQGYVNTVIFNRWFGDSVKVQYNSLTMLLSSFMQEFGPISSHVYCVLAQITNNKFVVELSIRNLNKGSI